MSRNLVRMLAADIANAVDGALGTAEVTTDDDLVEFDVAIAETVLAGSAIAQVKAEAWQAAIEEARLVVNRRSRQHEIDIDLITLPNPHIAASLKPRQEPTDG